jgi:hypothetical protein
MNRSRQEAALEAAPWRLRQTSVMREIDLIFVFGRAAVLGLLSNEIAER